MDVPKTKLSKEQLKKKLDTLGEEIKFRISEAKKNEGTGVGSAHKTDIKGLMGSYNSMKEAYQRMINNEKESLQLEDILAGLSEAKEEDPKKVEERLEFQQNQVEFFNELIELANQIKSTLPKAKKQVETYYKKNPESYATVFPVEEIKENLKSVLEKIQGVNQ